jgi:hypothetical protein
MAAKRPRDIRPSGFEYTEEMRARALARIAERRENENQDLLFSQYMEVMFRAFVRRLKRDHPEALRSMAIEPPEPPAQVRIPRPWTRKPRKRKGESEEQYSERVREFESDA